ncbi:MAG: DUF411 domain-containing protein [Helicobacteraceae bacterium]|jgi:hypothetical protein|nr:DUF411 domain-containing protein [Helicobacteraceae bacterium]
MAPEFFQFVQRGTAAFKQNARYISACLLAAALIAGAGFLAVSTTQSSEANGATTGAANAADSANKIAATIYKDPNCGCCNDWIAHLQKNGFETTTIDGESEARNGLGIPLRYASCHTAKIGAYAIEGHVPANDILRLLKEAPEAIGLSVPNMPIGAPGMDGKAYGGVHETYKVLLIANDGSASVFSEYK